MKMLVFIAALLAIAAAIWLARGAPTESRRAALDSTLVAQDSRRPASRRESRKVEPATSLKAPAPTSDPRIHSYKERTDFHNRVRTFFAQAAALPSAEKEATAQRLGAELTKYERAGEISASEALMLRLGLIRETSTGLEQQQRMDAMQERYRIESEKRVAAQAAKVDPMLELYRSREREIVAQVQAMEVIPDGLTRDEYLRRILQREREQLLGSQQ
ncbi:MAG: hypothetical protein ACREV5_06925 [Steroidobacter sp.]